MDSVALFSVSTEDRPDIYKEASHKSAAVALDAVLAGKTDYAAAHAVHASWLVDNPNCDQELKEDWATLRTDEQLKDCSFADLARAYLIEHREALEGEDISMDIIAAGGVMSLEDLDQDLFPAAWDPCYDDIAEAVPATFF